MSSGDAGAPGANAVAGPTVMVNIDTGSLGVHSSLASHGAGAPAAAPADASPMNGILRRVAGRILPIIELTKVLELAPKILAAAVASTVLGVTLIVAVAVARFGFPRPFGTCRALDMDAIAAEYATRLTRRALEVKDALAEGGPLVDALVGAYPALAALAARADGREGAVRTLRASLFNAGWATPIMAEASKLLAGPPVAELLGRHAAALRACDSPIGAHEQRCACAVADLRLVARAHPALTRTLADRTRRMDLVDSVVHFTEADTRQYTQLVGGNFRAAHANRAAADSTADKFFDQIVSLAEYLMTGQRETFVKKVGRAFKKLGKKVKKGAKKANPLNALKGIAKTVLKPFAAFFKIVEASATVFVTLFKVLADSIGDLANGLRMLMAGLRLVLRELDRGVIHALVAAAKLCLGAALYVYATVAEKAIKVVVAYVALIWLPCAMTVFHTAVYAALIAAKFALAVLDFATRGAVRAFVTTEVDPDAWWRDPGYERGNRFQRVVVSWRPCPGRYLPAKTGGLACVPCESGVPMYSPHALLMRRYTLGAFPAMARLVPVRTARAAAAYEEVCARGHHAIDPLALDAARALALCHRAVLGGGQPVEELAYRVAPETAPGADGAAGACAPGAGLGVAATRWRPLAAVAVAAVAAAALSQARALRVKA